jgi:hypothetical protein
MKFSFSKKHKGGFLVLTMVLLVCATVVIIVTDILLRSIGQANESLDSENSLKALGVVTACGEYALNQISTTTDGRAGWGFASTSGMSLAVGDETCYIYPVTASGTAKLIKASSTVSSFTKKVLIEVSTNTPNLSISSWKGVADF